MSSYRALLGKTVIMMVISILEANISRLGLTCLQRHDPYPIKRSEDEEVWLGGNAQKQMYVPMKKVARRKVGITVLEDFLVEANLAGDNRSSNNQR
jgi:hypothetical protein